MPRSHGSRTVTRLDHVVVRTTVGNPVHLCLHVLIDLILVTKLPGREGTEAPGNCSLTEEPGQE